ncbi:hypothetical protein M1P56_09770 [Streptomyces sp. HU2014]|uniref:hypothetical protein n=1 Tax=Streptomyces sp. HU2014 TaxID=2939414 RepID=UPI00200F5996|nr:hypothetical protein [Streptomyces sp. HU2014]UQI44613.1 hypothetical protein M1P56_09770 [Streptomyces sp. HU2014]
MTSEVNPVNRHIVYDPNTGWAAIYRADHQLPEVQWTDRTDTMHVVQTVTLWTWEWKRGYQIGKVWRLRDDGRYVADVEAIRVHVEVIR